MYDIWVNKEVVHSVPNDKLIFNILSKNQKSNVKTDVEMLWRRFGKLYVSDIIEDLLIIGISVFSVDKRLSRRISEDNWSRSINVHVPVIELEKWLSVKAELEELLSFLSGDHWTFHFRKSKEKLRGNKLNNRYELIDGSQFDCVSLFSGGLDSFAGALTLLEKHQNPIFVGFREYSSLTRRQADLINAIKKSYNKQKINFIPFNVSPRKPLNADDRDIYHENTSRSRSFLFIVGAVAVASSIGDNAPVYIPENGFIGINVPLTQSRNGSCSTRTTHPRFISSLNRLLEAVGIKHKIVNFYSKKSKGEIVAEHKNNEVFRNYYKETISCAHPSQSRYDKITPPTNCGYCYPCLIRKASLVSNGFIEDVYNFNYKLGKSFIEEYDSLVGKSSDLRALLYAVRKYIDNVHNDLFVPNILLSHGSLTLNEIKLYERVYKQSMHELIEMIKYEEKQHKDGLLEYLGWTGNK